MLPGKLAVAMRMRGAVHGMLYGKGT
jgi:hypothetical protein